MDRRVMEREGGVFTSSHSEEEKKWLTKSDDATFLVDLKGDI